MSEKILTALKNEIEGEVRFDSASRALYAVDASNYRHVPIGVVIPKTVKDVLKTVEVCRQFEAPILGRGGGTSLAGQCCNVAVVIDTSKYLNKVIEVNEGEKTASVQPGLVLDDLQKAALPHGLLFGPDPSTHSRCTLGGMIGNDSCGTHSLLAGRTIHNVVELDLLTYEGLRLKVGKINEVELSRLIANKGPEGKLYQDLKNFRDRYEALIRSKFAPLARRVSGYALDQLLPENGFHVARSLVGTEGTCAFILGATVSLIKNLSKRSLVVLGYADICAAAEQVPEILSHGPIGLEAMDGLMTDNMKQKRFHLREIGMLPKGEAWLFVEFGGEDEIEVNEKAKKLMKALEKLTPQPSMKHFQDSKDQREIWSIREFGPGATMLVPGKKDTFPGWEDSAVSPEKLGSYLRELLKLMGRYGYEGSIYGHFGEGCVHARIDFDLISKPGILKYRQFIEEAADLVVSFGGSLSGEHGDGQARGELLSRMYGSEMVQAFREFKAIWDPRNKMNPGKVVDARPLDADLRWKAPAEISPSEKKNQRFVFPEDGGSLLKATDRCVGIGKCRQKDHGVMCPSYRVTLSEEHSPRGRARLLHEMLEGEVVQGGWNDHSVKEALDLCLSCKGCKSECPTNVDIATYKAEFLSHYYEKNIRPISATFFGKIDQWASLGSKVPWIANFFMQKKPFSGWIKRMGGIAEERNLPKLAHKSFVKSNRNRKKENKRKPEVILWADTVHNYFYPEVLQAAVDVLEYAGFQVVVPSKKLCCGRPLYDFGMIAEARAKLQQIMKSLRPGIKRGVPIVGLEPSCLSVFRDELKNLFPEDPLAERLANQAFTLPEFLDLMAPGIEFPALQKKVVVQGHCHEQALMGMDAQKNILNRLGCSYDVLDAGCCGMAGAFGFEQKNYEISQSIAQKGVMAQMAIHDPGALVLADGFSCRAQIEHHLPDRRVYHLAELLQMSLMLKKR